MASDISYLHHVGLVVRDMQQALERYRRLGFVLTPPAYPMLPPAAGEPPRPFGAANTHITFSRNFVEIATVIGDDQPIPDDARRIPLQIPPAALPRVLETITRTVANLTTSLARFQGLHILVFATSDCDATADRLSAEGIGHSGFVTAQREIDTTDGPKVVPVRVLEIDGDATPEGRLAVADNPPAAIVDAQRTVRHPNGAIDLVESVLCVADATLDAVAQRYAQYLGRAGRHVGPTRVFDLEDSRVTLVPASNLATILPGETASALPAFVACAVAVRDLDSTRKLLQGNGISVMRAPAGDLFVPAAAALGAATIFRQAH